MNIEYKEGDLIEATKGETVIRVRLAPSGYPNAELALTVALRCDVPHLSANGYTIRLIERAPEPLPTEPGYYLDRNKALWILADDGWALRGGLESAAYAVEFAPFTRLRPEVETARAVLVALEKTYGEDYYRNKSAEWNSVAEQFGVTS